MVSPATLKPVFAGVFIAPWMIAKKLLEKIK